jgi:hypothetical protein
MLFPILGLQTAYTVRNPKIGFHQQLFSTPRKGVLLDNTTEPIIIRLPQRWCWNWQTGMVEGHVPQGVRVQVPPSATKN